MFGLSVPEGTSACCSPLGKALWAVTSSQADDTAGQTDSSALTWKGCVTSWLRRTCQLPCLHRGCGKGASSPAQSPVEGLLPCAVLVLVEDDVRSLMDCVRASPGQQLWLSSPLGALGAEVAFGGWPREAKVRWGCVSRLCPEAQRRVNGVRTACDPAWVWVMLYSLLSGGFWARLASRSSQLAGFLCTKVLCAELCRLPAPALAPCDAARAAGLPRTGVWSKAAGPQLSAGGTSRARSAASSSTLQKWSLK